ncbi:MAG TPA: (Fe-S)-binding protein [Syntrophomonadaceae bacterium]|nr:(Fe-S)-binding protein [Syntrophomonadaceae bacterium]
MEMKTIRAELKILTECAGCGLCSEECQLLSETEESPAEMATRGVRIDEAFSCSLCGRCEINCPIQLKPDEMFMARRIDAIDKEEFNPGDFDCFLPDEDDNIMALYRNHYDIDYDDLEVDENSETAFFPGCTLLTYSPGLVREAFSQIRQQCDCKQIITLCCGKPLDQLGMSKRKEEWNQRLIEQLKQLGVKRLIVGCPGCYYQLREVLLTLGIEIVTIYEVIQFEQSSKSKTICTLHDSCPDRFEGLFAGQVRNALCGAGFNIVEMERNREKSPCCGSGGQLSHFRPDLAEELIEQRLKEVNKTGAGYLVAYCLSCVLNFSRDSSGFIVRHALNLLLNYDEDYIGIKGRVAQIYSDLKE